MIIKKLKLMMALRRFQKEWRKRNSHNRTVALNVFHADTVTVGNHTYGGLQVFHHNYYPNEKLSIGHFCSMATGVRFFLAGIHKMKRPTTYPFMRYFLGEGRGKDGYSKGPITIGDDVWLGADATILSGVTIGQGAVIGGSAVVAKDVPPYAIAVGNPARVVKYRFDPERIELLLKIDYSKVTVDIIKNNRDFFEDESFSVERLNSFVTMLESK
jgi:virginiamycin A acetyltransferase